MERGGADRLALDDTAEEITHAGSEWPVPEPYRVGTSASMPAPAERETTVVAATARMSRRFPPVGRAGVPLAAALVLVAMGALIPYLASPSESAPGTGATQPRAPAKVRGSATPRSSPSVVPSGHRASEIEVPDVRGASVGAARRALREAGLKAETRLAESGRPDGVVLEQEPEAGDHVARASAIVLVVSDGPSEVAVPDVVGLRADEAARLLRRAGLRVEIRLVRSSDEAGVVVAQRPAGETSQRHGALVRLDVSEAAPELRTVRVPRLEGLQLDRAKARLRARGLRWTVDEVPSSRPPGVVVGQSDAPGDVVERGTRVVLEVSSGPALESVPDVVGLDVVLARQQLEAAGFVVLVLESPTTDPAEDGIVLDQSPRGGTRARQGTEVTLHVGIAG